MSTILKRMSPNGSDHFQTPEWPVIDLMHYLWDNSEPFRDRIPEHGFIWEPACGKGRMVTTLNSMNYRAFGTDIQTGRDFLDPIEPLSNYSCIITNPPFSLKDQFLKRCYELGVPFALLLPIQALSGIKRSKMFKEHGLQVLVLSKRVDFEYEDGTFKGKPWFNVGWFTNGFSLPKDLDWL